MPTMAMSSGSGALARLVRRRSPRPSLEERRRRRPSTAACRRPGGGRPTAGRRPRRPCTCPSVAGAASSTWTQVAADAASMPLLAIRSRPTLSSSSVPTPRGSVRLAGSCRSCLSAPNSSVNGLGTHRVACPGAVSSRTVDSAASDLQPEQRLDRAGSTASSVNRYAVPISTPTAAPRSASGAASGPTIAAERASWMPPANKDLQTSGRPRLRRIDVELASHKRKLVRGPTCPPHSAPSNTNLRAPAQGTVAAVRATGHADRWRCRPLPAPRPGPDGLPR